MKITELQLPGLIKIEPRVFGDNRGFFFEQWNRKRFFDAGLCIDFVQDNISRSSKGVLRGLHFQNPHPQGKLISVLDGAVFDVVVDLRKDSPTFKKWLGIELSSLNHIQLFIPPGFAHGFLVTSESALFSYKCTQFYDPQSEKSLLWNDPEIGIDWPQVSNIQLSEKDRSGKLLQEIVSSL